MMYDNSESINTIVYAARLMEKKNLILSSSGGMFTAISDVILDAGYGVICCTYNYANHTAEFILTTQKAERNKARGSKYMQSKMGNIFTESANWLNKNPGKQLVFFGMGCQADGFRNYIEMQGLRNRVYIVDIICHGVPSPKLWRKYAEGIEKKYGEIEYLTFKDKRNGWKNPTAYVRIKGGEIPIKDYVSVFYSSCALRPSCYRCPYTTMRRKVDLTIGDFWHIEDTIPGFYDSIGVSVCLIHTDKGKKLFKLAKEALDYQLSNTEQCWQANLEAPTPMPEHRQEFWKDYQRKGIDYIMKKYGTVSLKSKVKNKLLKIMGVSIK